MVCQKCGAVLADGTLICTECGASAACDEQRARMASAQEKMIKSSSVVLKGPLGIISAILLCLWAAFSIVSLLTSLSTGTVLGIILSLGLNVPPIIFAIIAAVGMWKIIGKRDISKGALDPLSRFFAVKRGYAVAYHILGIIGCGFVFLIFVFLDSMLGSVSMDLGDIGDVFGGSTADAFDSLDGIFDYGAFLVFFFVSGIVVAIIFYLAYMVQLYYHARVYCDRITAVNCGSPYNADVSSPHVRIFVMAGINLTFALITIAATGSIFAFLTTFVLQLFMIFTGIEFVTIHNAYVNNARERAEAEELLKKLEKETKRAALATAAEAESKYHPAYSMAAVAEAASQAAAQAAAKAEAQAQAAAKAAARQAASANGANTNAQPVYTAEQVMQMMQMMMKMQQANNQPGAQPSSTANNNSKNGGAK